MYNTRSPVGRDSLATGVELIASVAWLKRCHMSVSRSQESGWGMTEMLLQWMTWECTVGEGLTERVSNGEGGPLWSWSHTLVHGDDIQVGPG